MVLRVASTGLLFADNRSCGASQEQLWARTQPDQRVPGAPCHAAHGPRAHQGRAAGPCRLPVRAQTSGQREMPPPQRLLPCTDPLRPTAKCPGPPRRARLLRQADRYATNSIATSVPEGKWESQPRAAGSIPISSPPRSRQLLAPRFQGTRPALVLGHHHGDRPLPGPTRALGLSHGTQLGNVAPSCL